MAEIHTATASPLAKSLVEDAVAFIEERLASTASQAAGVNPNSPENAASFALRDIIEEMVDHLHIDFAVTLAAHALTPREDPL